MDKQILKEKLFKVKYGFELDTLKLILAFSLALILSAIVGGMIAIAIYAI
jgi:hypothetical protein